jgi:hypothetical protein
VGSELFVALCFVSLLQLVNCFANERASRLEHPFTLRASEALKIGALNPDQLAWHCRIISQTLRRIEEGPIVAAGEVEDSRDRNEERRDKPMPSDPPRPDNIALSRRSRAYHMGSQNCVLFIIVQSCGTHLGNLRPPYPNAPLEDESCESRCLPSL